MSTQNENQGKKVGELVDSGVAAVIAGDSKGKIFTTENAGAVANVGKDILKAAVTGAVKGAVKGAVEGALEGALEEANKVAAKSEGKNEAKADEAPSDKDAGKHNR